MPGLFNSYLSLGFSSVKWKFLMVIIFLKIDDIGRGPLSDGKGS